MKLTPELLLQAYGCGVFPMAESAEDPDIFWGEPEQRGILPLAKFHLSRRLRRTLRQTPFQFCINQDFSQVVDLCAAPHPDRPSTWINTTIKGLYQQLHEMGNAHSVEVWHEDEVLVHGLLEALHVEVGRHDGGGLAAAAEEAARLDQLLQLLVPGEDAEVVDDAEDQFGPV